MRQGCPHLIRRGPGDQVSRLWGECQDKAAPRWGESSHGGETLCAPSLCASLVICLSLHFVVGVGRVAVGEWYHGGFTLCAALLLCSP